MEKPDQITLDKSVPEIAEAFQNCQPGDMYKVVTDDENSVVLEKEYSDKDKPEENMAGDENYQAPKSNDERPASDNPAIAVLIGKKKKQ